MSVTRGALACVVLCATAGCRAGDARTPEKTAAAESTVPRTAAAGDPDSAASPLAETTAPAISPDSIPLVRGLTLVSVYRVPEGERENTVVLNDVTPDGIDYGWRYRERRNESGDAVTEDSFERFVSAADLAAAPRLNSAFQRGGGREETPGYTAMSFSRAVYNRLSAHDATPYTTMGAADSGSGLNLSAVVPYRGTLSAVSVEPIAILLNGRRVSVPTLHVHGRFTYQTRSAGLDFWILADSANPLILRSMSSTAKLFQMIRVDLPARAPVEAELEHDCRAELPGIYFGFASAELQPASDASLASVAALLARHPNWSLVVEGHTDSVGNDAANRRLSADRAEAVRAALVAQHGVAAARLRGEGFGATRPREPNTTLEGRARNRRVELVRPCDSSKD
jgi:OmpA family protein